MKNSNLLILAFIFVVILMSATVLGQGAGNAGKPFITNFSPKEYAAGPSNWAIVQDKRGVMYFGNDNGILEYDGSNWQLIHTPKNLGVRSLAIDDEGRIYAGSIGEFGYLAPDSLGQMQYISLLPKLPPEDRQFEDVWGIDNAKDGVYFQTTNKLFRWAENEMKVWRMQQRLHVAAVLEGTYYIRLWEVGLTRMEGDTLVLVPGGEQFADERIYVMLPYDEERILVGTRRRGLYLYDGETFSPFKTEADDIIQNQLYSTGAVLADGSFALNTLSNGLVVIDRQGRLQHHITNASGLSENTVFCVYSDRQDGLWLGLGNGLSRVEILSPLSRYEGDSGLQFPVYDIVRYKKTLYASTQHGVFWKGNGSTDFQPVSGISSQCFDLLVVDGELLATSLEFGLYRIDGRQATVIRPSVNYDFRVKYMFANGNNPRRLFVVLDEGIAVLQEKNGQWIDKGLIPGSPASAWRLTGSVDGNVWIGTPRGCFQIVLPPEDDSGESDGQLNWMDRVKVKPYANEHGLPDGLALPYLIAGEIYAATFDKLFRFQESSQSFIRDTIFSTISVNPLAYDFYVREDASGQVWLNLGAESAVATPREDGTYEIDKTPFWRFSDMPLLVIYPEISAAGNSVWFGGIDKLIHYNPAIKKEYAADYPALIRNVTVGEDSLIFGGASTSFNMRQDKFQLSYTDNTIRFQYAAPTYDNPGETRFQTMLEGFDKRWSSWTPKTEKEFINLSPGEYRFRVQAKNIYQHLSEKAEFSFKILPPWYSTWWAYLLYILAAGAFIFAGARLQHARGIKRERERSQLREAELRARAAEAENARHKNIELLSDIGKEIAASLEFETIFYKLYEHINKLVDATIFGVGIYHPEQELIEYKMAMERGKRYAPYTRDTRNKNQFPVWCIENRKPVFINDVANEYSKYIEEFNEIPEMLEDGTRADEPISFIYLPLMMQDRVLGIITIQSLKKNAYSEHDLNILQNLATYSTIALENARLFEESKEARASAEEANEAKSAFLSTVSHELRTPLTSVLGFAKIIKKRLEDRIFPALKTDDRKIERAVQQVEQNISVVVSEGERLTALINDVLDLAKIEAGKVDWQMESVSIPEIIDRATAATASLFENKNLPLKKEIDNTLPKITGDRDRLIQVLINFISNAVKFTDEGSITCSAKQGEEDVIISVTDTGDGIAIEDQPKVFEKFKQVGDTLTDKPKGTGLGLPICREIVEHHGGRIWVKSELGKGSTFSFAIPIKGKTGDGKDAAGQIELELSELSRMRSNESVEVIDYDLLVEQLKERVSSAAPASGDQPRKILVVDDEAHIRNLLRQELGDAGYLVEEAKDGRIALEMIRQEKPDLLILDVMMPEISGFDLAAVLKNDPETMDIPIIILSIVQDRERGFRLGVDRYLTKPIDTAKLFKEVDALLSQGKSHKKVMVVDEDVSTAKTLMEVLQARGYHVVESNGRELVEKAVSEKPDIIILNSVLNGQQDIVKSLRFEKGLENVLFLMVQ